jgi:DNA-binding Xre family transcriptional regulator
MIEIKIADIAKKKGLPNAYALQRALECSPTMASRLWRGDFKQIGIETIDSLCELFQCSPSDLIVFRSKDESAKPTAEKPARQPETVKRAASGRDLLTTIQVAERLELSRKSINDFINQGRLKATKGKQNHNFISESDLQEFVAARGRGD